MNPALARLRRPDLGGPPSGAPGRALLVARLRMWRNGLALTARHHPRRLLLQTGVLLPAIVALVGGVFFASLTTFREADAAVAAAALSVVFGGLVVGGFLGSASLVLQSLYLATDLPFLLTLPIPLRVAYGAKVVEAMLGAGPLGLILAAVLAGYGVARGTAWPYAAVAPAVGIALLAAVTSLGVLAVALIARLVPPRRARRFLALVSVAIVALTWAGWRLITHGASGSLGTPVGLETLTQADRTLVWTPLGWAARTVVAAGAGDHGELVLYGSLFAASVVVVGLGAFAVFVRTFAVGAGRLRAASMPRPRGAAGRRVDPLLVPLPHPLAALVLKEWLTMARDLRRLSGAVWPLGMVAVYAVALGRGESGAPADAPGLRFWLSAGTLLLVPWGASLGIAIYAFGTERRNFHLLRALPVAPRTILLAKVLASFLPILLVGEVAVAAVSLAQGAGLGEWLGMTALVAWATLGYVTIDTAGAALAPNFAAEHVQRSTRFFGRAVSFVAGAAFTLATALAAGRLVLFATGVPASLRPYLEREAFGVAPLGWPLAATAAALAALTVAAAFATAEAHLARLIRDGE